ncbi:hypothetical protein OROGR_004164 [Orobanche gracilis]
MGLGSIRLMGFVSFVVWRSSRILTFYFSILIRAGVFPLLCVWLGFVGLILSGVRVCCGRLGGGEERNERRFGQRRRDSHSLTF